MASAQVTTSPNVTTSPRIAQRLGTPWQAHGPDTRRSPLQPSSFLRSVQHARRRVTYVTPAVGVTAHVTIYNGKSSTVTYTGTVTEGPYPALYLYLTTPGGARLDIIRARVSHVDEEV